MFHIASELHNKFVNKYFDECYDLEGEEKEELGFKFIPIDLKIKACNYNQFYKKISHDHFVDYDSDKFIDTWDMPPLESNEEEVKEETWLRILTPNILLTRLLILLAQI